MAAELVNLTGFVFDLTPETGINIESISQKFSKKKKEVPNESGGTRGFASYDPRNEISISGEIAGSTGIAAAEPGVALTVAGVTAGHGVNAGLIYTDEVTLDHQREEFKKISVTATRYPLITSGGGGV